MILLTILIFSNCTAPKNRTASTSINSDHPVWQWSVNLDSVVSKETNDHPEAYLWIPENCERVKGVVLMQNNMIEEGILEHPAFRRTMKELGFAEVWVDPAFTVNFDFHGNAPDVFQAMMEDLAIESGYKELTTAPVIPVGHSALATFPWNFAAWNPERTLAVISIHGDAPQTNLTGYGGANIDWNNRNIDSVPGLFVMGEYEWWEDRISPGFTFQQRNPGSVITWFADAGHGHFDYSDELIDYIGLYLKKAVSLRLPEMKPIDPKNGWLISRWRKDSLPEAEAAPYEQFEGNRKTASWVFDEEMAEATEAFYAKARGKKQQYIGLKQSGKVLNPENSHVGYQLRFDPLEDGISFRVHAFFADSTQRNPVTSHASSPLIIEKITGPVRRINDSTFQIHFGKLGFSNRKRSNVIWLLASNDGDEKYKSAVQQMELRFPLINKKGNYQQIHFPPIQNQSARIKSIPLKASSTANVPVHYYVKKGPAFVSGDSLVFTEIPPRAKYPIEVTVVAWQYGKANKLQSARPIERSFYIRSGSMKEVNIKSLEELAKYACMDNQVINMQRGIYRLSDHLTGDSIAARRKRKQFQFMTFSGSGNIFNLEGVVIEVDTELRTVLNPPIHTSEFLVTGDGNTIEGLEIKNVGDGTSPGGASLEIAGESNIVRSAILRVRGSFPYGYGDLFGKGGPDVISHQKHSGVLITGSNTQVYGCKLYMRSFGHGFFVQKNAESVHFENCYVEGEMRATDDILAETSGPAYDVDFRTWTKNRKGKYVVTPGYMKSLCEDGFRTYGEIKNISFKNCTAKHTRGGFELRTNGGIRLENCTTIGTERAYWIGDGAKVINCKGDASYGPLLFVEGNNVDVEMYIVSTESEYKVYALATIQGENNQVNLKPFEKKNRSKALPILIGYTHPQHGEAMSPYGRAPAKNLDFINKTIMPVRIGEQVTNSNIISKGPVVENLGENNTVK